MINKLKQHMFIVLTHQNNKKQSNVLYTLKMFVQMYGS